MLVEASWEGPGQRPGQALKGLLLGPFSAGGAACLRLKMLRPGGSAAERITSRDNVSGGAASSCELATTGSAGCGGVEVAFRTGMRIEPSSLGDGTASGMDAPLNVSFAVRHGAGAVMEASAKQSVCGRVLGLDCRLRRGGLEAACMKLSGRCVEVRLSHEFSRSGHWAGPRKMQLSVVALRRGLPRCVLEGALSSTGEARAEIDVQSRWPAGRRASNVCPLMRPSRTYNLRARGYITHSAEAQRSWLAVLELGSER